MKKKIYKIDGQCFLIDISPKFDVRLAVGDVTRICRLINVKKKEDVFHKRMDGSWKLGTSHNAVVSGGWDRIGVWADWGARDSIIFLSDIWCWNKRQAIKAHFKELGARTSPLAPAGEHSTGKTRRPGISFG